MGETTELEVKKWRIFRYPTIMSGTVFRWSLRRTDAEVNASRDGVSFDGHWPILSDTEELINVIRDAEFAHKQLAKNRDWEPQEIGGIRVEYPAPFGGVSRG